MEQQDDINNTASITRGLGKIANWMIWSWCSTNFHHTIPYPPPHPWTYATTVAIECKDVKNQKQSILFTTLWTTNFLQLQCTEQQDLYKTHIQSCFKPLLVMLLYRYTDGYTPIYGHVLFLLFLCVLGFTLNNLINSGRKHEIHCYSSFSHVARKDTYLYKELLWLLSTAYIILVYHLYKASRVENYFHQKIHNSHHTNAN